MLCKYIPRRSEVADALILLFSSDGEGIVDHDCAHIIVIVGSSRSMNDHRASDTISVLGEGVRVIPTSAELLEQKGIGTRGARCDGTFGDTGYTILVVGSLLSDS
jgi:hypothetical protein